MEDVTEGVGSDFLKKASYLLQSSFFSHLYTHRLQKALRLSIGELLVRIRPVTVLFIPLKPYI